MLQFYLDIYTRRKIQLHQGIYRLLSGFQDIQQPLVGPHFKLFTGLLVNVRRPQDAVFVDVRRQRNGTYNLGSCLIGGIHDVG